MMVSTLAKSAFEQGRTILIGTGADAAFEKLKTRSTWLSMRISVGLERRTMLQSRKKPEDLKTEDAGSEASKA